MNVSNLTMADVSTALGQSKPMKLKFVMLDVSGIPTPIIFPAHLPHDTVKTPYEVISAGFCEIESMAPFWSKEPSIKVLVSGGSINLQKSARAEDAGHIERALR